MAPNRQFWPVKSHVNFIPICHHCIALYYYFCSNLCLTPGSLSNSNCSKTLHLLAINLTQGRTHPNAADRMMLNCMTVLDRQQ